MKSLLFIAFLAFIQFNNCGFSQSKKKINKQLLVELEEARQIFDSCEYVHTSQTQELKNEQSKIYSRLSVEMRNPELSVLSIQEDIERKCKMLRSLDVDPNTIIPIEEALKAIQLPDLTVVKRALSAQKKANEYTWVDDNLNFNGSKYKEQNVLLQNQINLYNEAFYSNELQLEKQRIFLSDIKTMNVLLDSISVDYMDVALKMEGLRMAAQYKIDKCGENYRVNGPKGFSEAYRKVFPDLHVVDEKPSSVASERNTSTGDNDFVERVNISPTPPSPEKVSAPEIFDIVDVPAEYPGGVDALKTYLVQNVRYPDVALELGIKGKCYLKFVVSSSGNISNVKVQKGISDCMECDQEAVRLVKAMPDWIPAKNGGKAVNSWYTLPIIFNVQ